VLPFNTAKKIKRKINMKTETDRPFGQTWKALFLRVLISPIILGWAIGFAIANTLLWAFDRNYDNRTPSLIWESFYDLLH
jgi:hypothetical protein